jgi:hypothetical protein
LVPTSAQTRAEGQATPETSSTGSGAADPDALVVEVDLAGVDVVDPVELELGPVVHVWPPSVLCRSSPCAGTTALTVVPVVPAARHDVAVAQTALRSTPTPAGTVADVHVWPPSVLSATAP